MGREKKEKKENNGYGERLREITAVLKKHAITRGVSPEKLRLILEDLGPTYIKLGQIMSLRSDILLRCAAYAFFTGDRGSGGIHGLPLAGGISEY